MATQESRAQTPSSDNQLIEQASEPINTGELSQSPDINNQLGEDTPGDWEVEASENNNHQNGKMQPRESTGARGQTPANQTLDLSIIVEMIRRQTEEQQRNAEEQKKNAEELAAEMKKNAEEQKELTTELKKQIEEQSKRTTEALAKQADEITNNLLEKMKQEQQKTEARITEKLELCINDVRDEVQQKFNSLETSIEERNTDFTNKLEESSRKNETEIRGATKKIDRQIKEMRAQQERNNEEIRATVNNVCETQNAKLTQVDDEIKRIKDSLSDTAEKVESVSVEKGKRLDEINTKLTQVADNQTRLQTRMSQYDINPIARGEPSETQRDITFNGEDQFPMEFLGEMENLQATYYADDQTKWIGRHLTGGAAVWWRLVKGQINNFAQFKEVFMRKYWSDTHQEAVRDQLEYGRFHSNGKRNMVEYMEHQLLKSRQLIPVISDQHLIKKLARHYDREIQIAVVTRGVRSISEFGTLLLEYMSVKPKSQGDRNVNQPKPTTKNEHPVKAERDGHKSWRPGNQWSEVRNEKGTTRCKPTNTITVERTGADQDNGPSTSSKNL